MILQRKWWVFASLGMSSLRSALPNAPQCDQAPYRVGSQQADDAGGHEGTVARLHQISQHAGHEEKQKRNSGEKKSRAAEVRMRHPQHQEQHRDRERSGVAKVARAWP